MIECLNTMWNKTKAGNNSHKKYNQTRKSPPNSHKKYNQARKSPPNTHKKYNQARKISSKFTQEIKPGKKISPTNNKLDDEKEKKSLGPFRHIGHVVLPTIFFIDQSELGG